MCGRCLAAAVRLRALAFRAARCPRRSLLAGKPAAGGRQWPPVAAIAWQSCRQSMKTSRCVGLGRRWARCGLSRPSRSFFLSFWDVHGSCFTRPGIWSRPVCEDDLLKWESLVIGPALSPYAFGFFTFRMQVCSQPIARWRGTANYCGTHSARTDARLCVRDGVTSAVSRRLPLIGTAHCVPHNKWRQNAF